MSILKKLAGETAIYGGSTVISRLLNFIIVTPYLTRVFEGPRREEYGIHGLMYGFSALLLVLLIYGMETAYFRFASREEDKRAAFSTAAFSLLGSTVLFVVLLLLFAEPVAGIITRPGDAIYIVFFAFIIGCDVLCAVPYAKLRLENRPYRFAALKILNILVNAFFLLFFLEALPRLSEAGWSWADLIYAPQRELSFVFIANLIASTVSFLIFLPLYVRTRAAFDHLLWRRMLVYALPLVIVGFSGMINQLADRFLLRYLLPGSLEQNLEQVGIYAGCAKIAVLMSLFTQAFRYASEPFFFRYAEQSDARQMYAQVGQAFALVGSLAFLGIMLYMDLVRYLVDESYWVGLEIVPVLLLAYLLLGLYYNLSVWYKLTDLTHLGGYVSVGGVGVTLAANFLLIPRIGILGAAWATFACFAFILIVSYFLGRKYYPVPYPALKILTYIGLAVGAFLFARPVYTYLEGSMFLRLLAGTAILLLYTGIIFWLERRHLYRIFPFLRR
jgi:O-antigen/teichoic acid export membrane protein